MYIYIYTVRAAAGSITHAVSLMKQLSVLRGLHITYVDCYVGREIHIVSEMILVRAQDCACSFEILLLKLKYAGLQELELLGKPLLSFLENKSEDHAAVELETLRILQLGPSLNSLAAFYSTLKHLVLPGLAWATAGCLSAVLGRLPALEVRTDGHITHSA